MSRIREFYVGYLPMPENLGRFVVRVTIGVVAIVAVVAAVISLTQIRAEEGTFEYGTIRKFEGRVIAGAAPALVSGDGPYLLVRPWKYGASDLVEELDGSMIRLNGTLIHRGGTRMIEVIPDSIEVIDSASRSTSEAPISFGRVTLAGEIVDSKCHLGVMKPGEGKTHRSCASLCIRGGIPPLLLAKESGSGAALRPVLVAPDGSAVNEQVLSIVAEPVEITGELELIEGMLFLRADPKDYRLLSR